MLEAVEKTGYIFQQRGGSYIVHHIDSRLIAEIYGHGRGWVFTPKAFSGLADPRSIGMVLTRLSRKGTIRRLGRGLYDYPRRDPRFGILAPSIDAIAKALAGRDAIRLQPSGGYAANLLGLSAQVPMKVVFLTDGPSRHVQLGRQEVILKHTTPRNMATAGRISGMVIQALRHLGQHHVDDSVVKALKHRLNEADKKQLLKDLRYAPAWVATIMKRIAEAESA